MKYEIKNARLKQPRDLERVNSNKSGYRELMKSRNQDITESRNQDKQNDDEGKERGSRRKGRRRRRKRRTRKKGVEEE